MHTKSNPKQWREWLFKLRQFLHLSPQTPEQLITLLRHCSHQNILDGQSLKMMEGVLQTATMQVRDIMVPRAQMVCIAIADSPEHCIEVVQSAKHSRYPVIGESRDDILGILMAKDLLVYCNSPNPPSIESLYHSPLFTPESKRLDELLRDFQVQHHHMAIVADEYGGVAGLVTIEDVIEQIVGDIEDEFYEEEPSPLIQRDGDTFLIQGITDIETVSNTLSIPLNRQQFDTIGGLLTVQFGHIPKAHEAIHFAQYEWRVVHADERCIRLISAKKSIN